MSIAEEAKALAAEKQVAGRAAALQRREAELVRLQQIIRERTSLDGVHLGTHKIWHLGWGERSMYGSGTTPRVAKSEDGEVFQVDDLEVAFIRKGVSSSSVNKDLYLVHNDVDFGRYADGMTIHGVYAKDPTDQDRRANFLNQVSSQLASKKDHPIRLAEGSQCPSCGQMVRP